MVWRPWARIWNALLNLLSEYVLGNAPDASLEMVDVLDLGPKTQDLVHGETQ